MDLKILPLGRMKCKYLARLKGKFKICFHQKKNSGQSCLCKVHSKPQLYVVIGYMEHKNVHTAIRSIYEHRYLNLYHCLASLLKQSNLLQHKAVCAQCAWAQHCSSSHLAAAQCGGFLQAVNTRLGKVSWLKMSYLRGWQILMLSEYSCLPFLLATCNKVFLFSGKTLHARWTCLFRFSENREVSS